ncbi:Arginase/deacetylase [Panus rudis PR-1116 ss-1]|nr:Arginase/deacetylase [Panus rudis PR-1116 ss-1]
MCPQTPSVTAYILSNDLVKASSQLPSNKNRSLIVHSLIKALRLLSVQPQCEIQPLKLMRPAPATTSELSIYHSREYLEYVLNPRNFSADGSPLDPEQAAEFGIEEDCPWFPELPSYVRLVAGATLTAANALIHGHANIAINWEGGRHHAQKEQASGFCYVSDCVLAILALKRSRLPAPSSPALLASKKPRIMYLDLDLHFSDGVSHVFHKTAGIPQILSLSIHHSAPGFFPASALSALPPESPPESSSEFDPFTLSVPLAAGASSRTFASVWLGSVEKVKNALNPDYVVVQCGVDGLAGDQFGIWNWCLGESEDASQSDEGSLGWCIRRICHSWGCKILLLGGGGYNSPNAARAWAYITSIALNQPLSLNTQIPDHPFFPMYAPSFTLDVPPGTLPDQNTDAYLQDIDRRFDWVCEGIRKRLAQFQYQ